MASKVLEVKKELEAALRDPSKPWTPFLASAESKSGIDRLYIFVALLGIIGLWLVFGFAGQLLCNMVGFLYPAYVSIRAIESPATDDDTKWLTYWVVFAAFSIMEYFADIIVGWFPLYWLIKCIFFVWLMIPTDFNGSLFLYRKLIRPSFLKYQGQVDGAVSNLKATAAKLLEDKPHTH